MRQLAFSSILLSLLAASGAAAAFDCAGATVASSIVICSDRDLTRLADERQEIYDETRSRLTPDQQKLFWEDQKSWVRSYTAACGIRPMEPAPIPAPASVVECFKRAAEARAAYLRTYGLSAGAIATAQGAASASPPGELAGEIEAANVEVVPLKQEGGVFVIPVQINKAITLPFVVDSGAADVQIPVDVFSTLIRTDTVSRADVIGKRSYVLADGSTKDEPEFLIRELKIGKRVLRDVTASVGPAAGELLLGQSFLSRFQEWALDNDRHVLKLVERSGGTASAPAAGDSGHANPMATVAAPEVPREVSPLPQNAVVCGRRVEYTLDQAGSSTGFLGVWTGSWNNPGRLCGGLIVEKIGPYGAVDLIYIYGPSQPGSRLAWKQQQGSGHLKGENLSFEDDQGSAFTFYHFGLDTIRGTFLSRSGRLTGEFHCADC